MMISGRNWCVSVQSDLRTLAQFEQAYYQVNTDAYSWQELYNDSDDDDDLMQLLRLIRKMT